MFAVLGGHSADEMLVMHMYVFSSKTFLLVREKDYLCENIVSFDKSAIFHFMAEFASHGKNIVNFHLSCELQKWKMKTLKTYYPLFSYHVEC